MWPVGVSRCCFRKWQVQVIVPPEPDASFDAKTLFFSVSFFGLSLLLGVSSAVYVDHKMVPTKVRLRGFFRSPRPPRTHSILSAVDECGALHDAIHVHLLRRTVQAAAAAATG